MKKIVRVLAVFVCLCSVALAEKNNQIADNTIHSKRQLEIIDSISVALNEFYIFPDIAKEIEKYLRRHYKDNIYRDITSAVAFTERLNDDIRLVSKDAHLSVEYKSDEYFASDESDITIEESRREWHDEQAYNNFGFTRVERLAGNIGYIQMRAFNEADWAGATAIAAMNFLAHCEAIIFDLRLTLGGQPSIIQLLASYFFDEPTQLSSFYVREGNKEQQFWTHAYVSGPRLADVKLYILTSRQTPSAAEAFVYDLKHLKRAIVIGEVTSGAAHPAKEHSFPELNIVISIPYGRAINPITGTNWEGTGVEPHIKVPAKEALSVAHLEALKALLSECGNDKRKAGLEWAVRGLEARLKPVLMTADEMKEYVGSYGLRSINIKGGALYYERQGRPEYLMVPMGSDLFMLEGMDVLRIQFSRDNVGDIFEMTSMTENGPGRSYQKE